MIPFQSHVLWPKTFRLVRAIYPPVALFEDIADPDDWELIAAAEAKTDPRMRDATGAIHLVPPGRRVAGPGASWAMARFVMSRGTGRAGSATERLCYRWNGRCTDAWLVYGEERWRRLP